MKNKLNLRGKILDTINVRGLEMPEHVRAVAIKPNAERNCVICINTNFPLPTQLETLDEQLLAIADAGYSVQNLMFKDAENCELLKMREEKIKNESSQSINQNVDQKVDQTINITINQNINQNITQVFNDPLKQEVPVDEVGADNDE